jgi:hypothetical protein
MAKRRAAYLSWVGETGFSRACAGILVERIDAKAVRLCGPTLADEPAGRGALQCLAPPAEVPGGDQVAGVQFKPGVVVPVLTPDSCLLDGAVHPRHLPIRPGMRRFFQPMFDIGIGARRLDGMAAEEDILGPHRLDGFRRPGADALRTAGSV